MVSAENTLICCEFPANSLFLPLRDVLAPTAWE